VISAVLVLLAGLIFRRYEKNRVAVPLALGLGYCLGWLGLWGWPRFPPNVAEHWVFFAAAGVALLSAIDGWSNWRWWIRAAGALAVMITVSWLTLGPAIENSYGAKKGACLVAGWGIAGCMWWWGGEGLSTRASGAWTNLILTLTAGAMGQVLMMSGSLVMGQMALILAAGLAGAMGSAWWLGWSMSRAGVIMAGSVIFGITIAAYEYSNLTLVNGILLLAAPMGAWIAELPLLRERRAWVRGLVRIAGAVAIMAPAQIMALVKFLNDVKTPESYW
jgi:hypothetical protein